MLAWRNYIGGEWTTGPQTMPVRNPDAGNLIGILPKSTCETARRAIKMAGAGQPSWAAQSIWERAAICRRIADTIDARRGGIARAVSLEQGRPFAEATAEITKAADGFRLASSLAMQMRGDTRGVHAVITPWNFPVNIVAREAVSVRLGGWRRSRQ